MAMTNEVKVYPVRRWLPRAVGLMLAAAASIMASRASAVDLTMDAAKTAAGAVQLCVGMQSGGDKVAGTQNDLVWDDSCAKLKANSCAAVPDSKKPLHGNTPANLPATYRALVFALDNVDPIRDGSLYCCEFELSGPGDGCCAVRLDRMGASDPVGTALTTNGKPEKVCLATGAAAVGAAPPAPPAPGPPADAGGGRWMWLLLIGVAVVVVAILIMRGRSS